MASNACIRSAAPASLAILTRDKITITLILMTAVTSTLQLYLLIHHQEMEASNDKVARFTRLLSIDWPAANSYRIPGYRFEKAMRPINAFNRWPPNHSEF